MQDKHVSGFVTLVGRPNVGKSTLLNYIIGQKISIISDKVQTTRHQIKGIYSTDEMQIIFIDTPGIHKPKHRLGDVMIEYSLQSLYDVDLILFLVNAEEGIGRGDLFIIEKLKQINKPVFLLINKIDRIPKHEILPLIDTYRKQMDFAEIVPLSALQGENVTKLLQLIKEYLPEGPKYYDEQQITEQSERFLVSELIREKVLHYTEEEIPHSITVQIESFEEKAKSVHIQALIITERNSQKKIIIGKQGSMLKKIGQAARQDIEQLLGKKVFLELWVKVVKDWRNKQALLKDFGYHSDL